MMRILRAKKSKRLVLLGMGLFLFMLLANYNSTVLLKSNELETSLDLPARCICETNLTEIDLPNLSNLTIPLFEEFEKDTHLNDFSFFHENRTKNTKLPSSFRISGSVLCAGEPQMLIFIPSVHNHYDQRKSIRETWASSLYNESNKQTSPVRLMFFFGEFQLNTENKGLLTEESKLYGDIVTGDFIDSYKNLSLKIATALYWQSKFCPRVSYIAKVDEDTFVNIPLMLRLLNVVSLTRSSFILGFRHAYKKPLVVRDGRWGVGKLYPYEFFPRYIYGHGYVLSNKASRSILQSLKHMDIIPNEDAFITGIMALTANVTRLLSKSFTHLFYKQTFCDVVYERFVTAIYKKEFLYSLWDSFQSKNCSNEFIK